MDGRGLGDGGPEITITIKIRSRIGRGRLRGCNWGKENWLGMGEPWAVDGVDGMDLVDGFGRARTGRWGGVEIRWGLLTQLLRS